jgi:hypothetical protein
MRAYRLNLVAEEALRARVCVSTRRRRSGEGNGRRASVPDLRLQGFDFDSKHQPAGQQARGRCRSRPTSHSGARLQWFDRANALGGRTANVIATLKGTVNPELIYVVSSHYDSVAIGPGADDDSSGTAALLETARIMATRPQAATIVFASFTAERQRRPRVRRAVADSVDRRRAQQRHCGWANDAA